MANAALAREALIRLLALPNLSKEARYYAQVAISHLYLTDPNIIHPGSPDAPGPFPEEGP
jgi:hypothetical protein